MTCPEPRRNRYGDDECPRCGATWDPADGPPDCTAGRFSATRVISEPGDVAANELRKIRAILARSSSTDS